METDTIVVFPLNVRVAHGPDGEAWVRPCGHLQVVWNGDKPLSYRRRKALGKPCKTVLLTEAGPTMCGALVA